MIELLVLDMDDTLYLERDYSLSGFAAAAHYFEDETLALAFRTAATTIFNDGGRGTVFNQALLEVGQDDNHDTISAMLTIFRDHCPDIELCSDADVLLNEVAGRLSTGLISDGYLPPQQRKVDALGIESRIDKIVLTESLGREYWKPHRKAFELLENHFGIGGDKCMYVGDNPSKDFDAPYSMGWKTVRIIREGALHQSSPDKKATPPDYSIESLQELTGIIFGGAVLR